MKYATIIVALAIGAFARPQDASTVTSAPPSAASAALTPQVSCVLACPSGDVTCQAACVGVARPNSSQVVETNECAAQCDQGDGSAEATEKYAECQQACFASLFPSSQTAFGAPAGSDVPSQAASNSASATGPVPSAASSGASQPSGASGASNAAASSTPSGAANSNNVHVAGAGFAGLVLALLAL